MILFCIVCWQKTPSACVNYQIARRLNINQNITVKQIVEFHFFSENGQTKETSRNYIESNKPERNFNKGDEREFRDADESFEGWKRSKWIWYRFEWRRKDCQSIYWRYRVSFN